MVKVLPGDRLSNHIGHNCREERILRAVEKEWAVHESESNEWVREHSWWESISVLPGGFMSWAEDSLLRKGLLSGKTLITKSMDRTLPAGVVFEAFETAMLEKLAYLRPAISTTGHANMRGYFGHDCAVGINGKEDGESFKVEVTGIDSRTVTEIAAYIEAATQAKSRAGRVYMLLSGDGAASFRPVGAAGAPLVRDNYTAETLAAYDEIARDLAAAEPGGRVSIVDGEPGTGKTYLVRGLLEEVHDAIFVIIPATMVQQLTQPSMVPAILDLQRKQCLPVVFIVEDADACLTTRMADNIGSISAVLNFGDGIMGHLMNVRIIATTNTPQKDIDPALLRPGRLSRHVSVGRLSEEHARRVYGRLLPNGNASRMTGDKTLAEVYKMARDENWRPPATRRRVGFGGGIDDEYE